MTAETGAEAGLVAWALIGANSLAICASVFTRKVTNQVTQRLEQKKDLILLVGGASLVESKVTEQETMMPIPVGGWIFYRILKTLETTTDETLSLKRRIKGFLWLFGGTVSALLAYMWENTGLGLAATFSIFYAIMLIISGTIGHLNSDRR